MSNPKQILDSLLVLEYQSGNKKAISLLVKKWHRKFCKQAYWYTRDYDSAKDIAQESWSVVLKKLHTLKDPDRFGVWALKIVTRKSLDWYRKNKNEIATIKNLNYDNSHASTIDSSNTAINEYLIKRLKMEIENLPIKQKTVLTLFYLESYSINQISEILEVSTGTVKSRLFTARENLKTSIKKQDYEK